MTTPPSAAAGDSTRVDQMQNRIGDVRRRLMALNESLSATSSYTDPTTSSINTATASYYPPTGGGVASPSTTTAMRAPDRPPVHLQAQLAIRNAQHALANEYQGESEYQGDGGGRSMSGGGQPVPQRPAPRPTNLPGDERSMSNERNFGTSPSFEEMQRMLRTQLTGANSAPLASGPHLASDAPYSSAAEGGHAAVRSPPRAVRSPPRRAADGGTSTLSAPTASSAARASKLSGAAAPTTSSGARASDARQQPAARPSSAGRSSRRAGSEATSPAPGAGSGGGGGGLISGLVGGFSDFDARPSSSGLGGIGMGSPSARPSTAEESEPTMLSGAEVFAILRLRGVITSQGNTGEHLLPQAYIHQMYLTRTEVEQLLHLREVLKQAHRNAPRGVSAARARATSPSASSRQSKEADKNNRLPTSRWR